jgi:hypothetical protein
MPLSRESEVPHTVRGLHLRLNAVGARSHPGRTGLFNLLRDGLLLSYCAAVGFVAAGIAASFYRMVTREPARFALLGEDWLGVAVTFLFCAVTGPAIIVDLALRRRRDDRMPIPWIFAGFAVAGGWSICSGILVVALIASLQGGLA